MWKNICKTMVLVHACTISMMHALRIAMRKTCTYHKYNECMQHKHNTRMDFMQRAIPPGQSPQHNSPGSMLGKYAGAMTDSILPFKRTYFWLEGRLSFPGMHVQCAMAAYDDSTIMDATRDTFALPFSTSFSWKSKIWTFWFSQTGKYDD